MTRHALPLLRQPDLSIWDFYCALSKVVKQETKTQLDADGKPVTMHVEARSHCWELAKWGFYMPE